MESIRKVFEPVFHEYGFELQDEVVWNGAGEDTVTAIAHYLDKDFQFTGIHVYINEDLIRALEQEKEILLKYGKDILSGDLSLWTEVVKRSEEYRTGTGKERWRIS